MNIKVLSAIYGLAFLSSNAIAQKATIISTTATERWKETKISTTKTADTTANLCVYTDSLLQDVYGFGATFNEIEWDAIRNLSEAERSKIMQSLFGKDGIAFSIGRTPIACNDYSYGYYSYNDVKDDYTMRNFTIGRDRFILIPFIKEALKIRPDLKMWASPWTPSTWMKVTEHYSMKSSGLSGTDVGHNRLDPMRDVTGNVTGFKMQKGYLEAYALYLSKYIQEYKKEGVNIDIIMPQNEIAWTPCWPCCTWRPEDFAIFLTQYLAPRFEQDSIKTDIWLGTINYPDPNYVRTFLKQKGTQQLIKGIGVQWTGMRALPSIHNEYPQFEYMQTENICGDGENDWSALERTWQSICHCFNNGVSSYVYWNMVLDETGKSWWEWKQNSLIIVDRPTSTIRYTDEFYLMKHLSHFIQPGSKMIKVSNIDNTLAFKSADGKIVIVIYNPSDSEAKQSISVANRRFDVTLPAKSINTVFIAM